MRLRLEQSFDTAAPASRIQFPKPSFRRVKSLVTGGAETCRLVALTVVSAAAVDPNVRPDIIQVTRRRHRFSIALQGGSPTGADRGGRATQRPMAAKPGSVRVQSVSGAVDRRGMGSAPHDPASRRGCIAEGRQPRARRTTRRRPGPHLPRAFRACAARKVGGDLPHSAAAQHPGRCRSAGGMAFRRCRRSSARKRQYRIASIRRLAFTLRLGQRREPSCQRSQPRTMHYAKRTAWSARSAKSRRNR